MGHKNICFQHHQLLLFLRKQFIICIVQITLFNIQIITKLFIHFKSSHKGFYCNRAALVVNEKWCHINELGKQVYSNSFSWSGNYQENLCTVRDKNNQYFHIDLNGQKVYSEKYIYAGDFKDGFACVKNADGFYKHIDTRGNFINEVNFLDLGIFHKNYATAKDEGGWHHIDKQGRELYSQRYLAIEPLYNGFALVTQFNMDKVIINEKGNKIITI